MTLFFMAFANCNKRSENAVLKIEMNLGSFGVESEGYPSIHVFINLSTDSSICKKFYDNPKYKDSTYFLSKNEIQQIYRILNNTDLEKLKNKYTVNQSDRPKSTTTFYTNTKKP